MQTNIMQSTSFISDYKLSPYLLTCKTLGTISQIGGMLYDRLSLPMQNIIFKKLSDFLWVPLAALSVLAFVSSIKVIYASALVFSILLLQLMLISARYRGNHETLNTRLNEAIAHRNFSEVLFLTKAGASFTSDPQGRPTLMHVAGRGDTELVDVLIAAGAPVNETDAGNGTALMDAAQSGHTRTVQTLLGYGANIAQMDLENWTALTYAARNGHTETVEALLEGGADINHADTDGLTPLAHATQGQHTETIQALLRHNPRGV